MALKLPNLKPLSGIRKKPKLTVNKEESSAVSIAKRAAKVKQFKPMRMKGIKNVGY